MSVLNYTTKIVNLEILKNIGFKNVKNVIKFSDINDNNCF